VCYTLYSAFKWTLKTSVDCIRSNSTKLASWSWESKILAAVVIFLLVVNAWYSSWMTHLRSPTEVGMGWQNISLPENFLLVGKLISKNTKSGTGNSPFWGTLGAKLKLWAPIPYILSKICSCLLKNGNSQPHHFIQPTMPLSKVPGVDYFYSHSFTHQISLKNMLPYTKL